MWFPFIMPFCHLQILGVGQETNKFEDRFSPVCLFKARKRNNNRNNNEKTILRGVTVLSSIKVKEFSFQLK